MEDPHRLRSAPIPGADPTTPHPLAAFCRGVGNIGLFGLEAVAAVLEVFWPPRKADAAADETLVPAEPRRQRTHPVDDAGRFPLND